MQQGNLYINIGPYGTQSNNYINYRLSGAYGTNNNQLFTVDYQNMEYNNLIN